MVDLEQPGVGPEPVKRYGRYFTGGAVAFVIAAVAWGCNLGSGLWSHERTLTRSDVSPWPFTVPSGTLRCHTSAVTFEANGVEYALNGSATESYPTPEPIWATDPAPGSGSGPRISLKPTVEVGLALC
ncbi:DUF2511 domain-containing protein [Kitasatospora sp. NPDC056138]|uniref:DUF2511 domain-containing protein n=1 Tax=Kitasatospora sp. NPDC056138 TaxID=3345724 RepID=UPI0035D9E548